jgi:glucose/mannose-6-phosphate isomerase
VNRLDPPYDALDPGGMAARIDGIPEQIEGALALVGASPWPGMAWAKDRSRQGPALLALGGMGGSGIAADLTAGLNSDRASRPVLVVRDYRWPAWLTAEALAVLCSYSGNTEETLALYREAGERRVARAAITTGGALAEACERDQVPWLKIPAGIPPRAALFWSWVPLTALVHSLGWSEDPKPAWGEAVAKLRDLKARLGTAVPEATNPAKQLARRIAGRPIYIYSGTERIAAVATRFRQQLHENGKLLAHTGVVPELNHNEIVGWERPEAFHREVVLLVLRDAEDAPEVSTRLALTADYARRQGAEVHWLEPYPGGRLARLAQQILFGDYLSLYLALVRGVDPTPVASIDEFKRRLSEAGAQHG